MFFDSLVIDYQTNIIKPNIFIKKTPIIFNKQLYDYEQQFQRKQGIND
tara:strand:- start:429 stop:572 length:144 start_codon:yes stop_codon:yes gene_type:complete